MTTLATTPIAAPFDAMAPSVTAAQLKEQLRTIARENDRRHYAARGAADVAEMGQKLDALDAERAKRAAAAAARYKAERNRKAKR